MWFGAGRGTAGRESSEALLGHPGETLGSAAASAFHSHAREWGHTLGSQDLGFRSRGSAGWGAGERGTQTQAGEDRIWRLVGCVRLGIWGLSLKDRHLTAACPSPHRAPVLALDGGHRPL